MKGSIWKRFTKEEIAVINQRPEELEATMDNEVATIHNTERKRGSAWASSHECEYLGARASQHRSEESWISLHPNGCARARLGMLSACIGQDSYLG